jgi:hypothetical protein
MIRIKMLVIAVGLRASKAFTCSSESFKLGLCQYLRSKVKEQVCGPAPE